MPTRSAAPLPALSADAEPDTIWSTLRASGAVRLRGAASTPAEFEARTEIFATNFRVHQDPTRRKYSRDDTTQGVSGGEAAIGLHAERAYLPGRPSLLFFCCLTPPTSGGATTLCDGAAVVEALSPESARRLDDMTLVWHTPQNPAMWQRLWNTTDPDEAGRAIDRMLERYGEQDVARHWFEGDVLHIDYRVPCLTTGAIGGRRSFANYLLLAEDEPSGPAATQADGHPVPADLMGYVRETADALTLDIDWQRGDLVVIDNTRCMHGRRAFSGGERRILVRMGDVHPRFASA